MRIIINVTDEQEDSGFIIGVLGNVVIIRGQHLPYDSFDFYLLEDIDLTCNWILYVYPDGESESVEVAFFPANFFESDYRNRTMMKWLAYNAEDIVRKCRVHQLLLNDLKQS